MKRILCVFLIISIIFSFSACKKKKIDDISSDVSSLKEDISSKINSSKEDVSSETPTSSEGDQADNTDIPTVATPIDTASINLQGLTQYENEKKGWGQGVRTDKNNRPVDCDTYQKKYGEYGGVFIMPADSKKMYLTFDEGYENGYTNKILDALKEKDCKAIFFITMPYAKAHPELVQRMIDEGHIVGNHTVKHKSMPLLTTEAAIDEIAELHNYMVENFNYTMTLFRPPMGEWSTRTLIIAKQLGYKTVLWSYAYVDYNTDNQMGVEKAFPKVTAAKHDGAIYLLHAVSKDNAEMMGDLIDNFRNDGYTLDIFK